jgi:predicted Zn-dependent protease
MATANSEAELAGVLAHEVGHITGKHSAERYSRGILTQLGASVASAAIGSSAASQVIGIGANLYSSSYSRGQESQADELGIRYLHHSGYDTYAMAGFLSQLEADHQLQQKIDGKKKSTAPSFFSTHPNTAGRVVAAADLAKEYPKGKNRVGRERHFSMIAGMTYGDSESQGFSRGQNFYHPELNFMFTAPKGYKIVNQPNQVLAVSDNGSAAILDMRTNKAKQDPSGYISQTWLKGQKFDAPVRTTINGMRAATTSFNGKINNKSVKIRVVAIEYSKDKIFRFQLAMPQNSTTATVEALKKTTYSFRRMTTSEKKSVSAQKIKIITARSGDTIQTLSSRMGFETLKVDRFMALNGLHATDRIVSGRQYKIVTGG